MKGRHLALILALLGCANGQDREVAPDASDDAAKAPDATIDVTPIDATPIDATPIDVTPLDAAPIDVAPVDAAPIDVAPIDAPTTDIAHADVSAPDAAPVDVTPPTPATLDDYLIQDVCVTAEGALLSDDPWDGCPAGAVARDLRVGEALPYHRHDQPGPGAPLGYQRKDSYPRPDARTVHSFDFAPFGEFNPDRDGYDVVETDGDYSSIIGTRDPTGLAQTFYGVGCRLDDAWLLLPRVGFEGAGMRTATLALVGWERAAQSYPGPCPARYDRSLTPYASRRVTFGGVNGAREKSLDAIVVSHYGGEAVATADHIERFYFTRAYGLTRWERWENNRGAPRTEGCNGPTAEGTFRRVDCRDWTQVFADETPTPAEVWPTPYAASNLVRNHDFGSGAGAPWERMGTSTTGAMTNVLVVRDADGNANLATNCAGPCSPGQNVYQDVPRQGLAGRYRFGARLWSETPGAAVELVVFQRDASARIVQRDAVSLTVGTRRERVTTAAFAVDPATDHFRFTLYLNAPNTVHLDDAWISR
jgi:hypothetical protein